MESNLGRVAAHTDPSVNRRIREQTDARIRHFAEHPDGITERLQRLEREWDIERTLEANAATVSILAVLLGHKVNPKWFMLSGVVGGFLLQHAVQGWCPPLPIFRRMGVRTQGEIDYERQQLEALRRDAGRTETAGS